MDGMNIVVGRGVGNIVFGLTEYDVVMKLGAPDKVGIDANGSRDLIYHEWQLVLKIEPDGRLGWIEVHDPQATWTGLKPWETERTILLDLLAEFLGESSETNDYGKLETWFFSDHQVELQYELGRLSAFNIGVTYDENDEPRWPT